MMIKIKAFISDRQCTAKIRPWKPVISLVLQECKGAMR